MTTFVYRFGDGRVEKFDAYYYKKEYNSRSEAYEYIFYDEDDEVLRTVPELWLDPIDGSPREIT